jgi:predicted kinase
METIIKPVIDELTADEVKLAAPKIMQYLKEGSKSEEPELIIIMGPVAGGKSCYIRENYSNGYVWIDMARIFFDLQSQTGIKLNRRTQLINFIGIVTLDLALLEKRNIVIELVGDELERIDTLIDAMKAHGYKTKITMINSVNDGCFTNGKHKKVEYMSSFYTEPFHLDWFERTAM